MNRQLAFTLVELLVALALSSIIFASAYRVIGNLVQYQTRSAAQAVREQDTRLLRQLFGQLVEQGIHRDDLYQPLSREPVFDGREDRLQILSRAWSRNFERPGYRVYRLWLDGERLKLRYRIHAADGEAVPSEETDTGIVLDSLRFDYFDGEGWRTNWREPRRLPRFIRLQARLPGGQWVEDIRETTIR